VRSKLAVLLLGCVTVLEHRSRADVHLVRRPDGSATIFNDNVGSGWRVNGRAPSDAFLIQRRDAVTPFDETIVTLARREGVDPSLVRSVMLIESNFNPRAVSRKGARGLMQLMPETARRFGVRNSFDATANIHGGIKLLAQLLVAFRGNIPLTLAAYNAGEGAVAKYSGVPPYPETQEYIRRGMVVYTGTPSPSTSSIPTFGGGFRGLETTPFTRIAALSAGPPVRLRPYEGALLMTNQAPSPRVRPILGRVESGPTRGASASLSLPGR
jgi:hypothetical protein